MESGSLETTYSPFRAISKQPRYCGRVVERISIPIGVGHTTVGANTDSESEINKWSVINHLPCKNCGKSHSFTSRFCGVPLFWFDHEKHYKIGPGDWVQAPPNAIHWTYQ